MKNILTVSSRVLRKIFPECIFNKLEYMAKYIVFSGFRENCMRRKKYGKLNPDKTFYVMRVDNPAIGILSAYLSWLCEMQEVDKNGYIPVFDLKNQYVPMAQDEEKAYNENAWTYYFDSSNCCPDSKIDEVYQSKNVILGWKNVTEPYVINWMTKILNKEEVAEFNRLAVKYMDFSSEIKKRAEKFLNKIPEGKKILGMALRSSFLRGEMLGIELYRGHPKQKTLDETIDFAQDLMSRWQCDYVFISVEDREWLETFKERFGEKCLWLERTLPHGFKNGRPVIDPEDINCEFKNITVQKKTSDYLTEIYILSQCNSLFGSLSSGMTVAQILNNNSYKYVNICYNGTIEI